MSLIENWIHIFESQDEVAIFPFLKGLNAAQKKTLLPQISKTARAYLVLKDRLINGKYFYRIKASRKQKRILNYSLFVIIPNLQSTSCKWLDIKLILTPVVLDEILNWYCPIWFSDFLNQAVESDFRSLPASYDLVMDMAEKKYIQPSELLIAKLLIPFIYSVSPNQKKVYQFQPEQLLKKPYTLKKHFWYLFEYPTKIYRSKILLPLAPTNHEPKENWHFVIKKYVESGDIDRIKLLNACLHTISKSTFNKFAISWFVGIIDLIKPTKRELLTVQEALFTAYNLSYPKATNTVLDAIRKIVDSPQFNVEKSLISFEKLLGSNAKSIALNAMTIIGEIAVNYPQKRQLLCEIVTNCFGNRFFEIQYKAAKFIQKYGQEHQQKLIDLIRLNKSNLFHTTKTILGDMLVEEFGIFSIQNIDNQVFGIGNELLDEEAKIVLINNFDEFVDLSLIVFDNKAPYHFDQFLANLLVFQKEIKGKSILKLMPLFRRAYQLVFNELPSSHGMLDNILATFLVDYADLLISQYPEDNQGLRTLSVSYLEKGFFVNHHSTPFHIEDTHLKRWFNPTDPSQVYTPIKLLLEAALLYLQQAQNLPLLSTPTHSPSWIHPMILVERLIEYQEHQIVPNTIDLQIAMSRVVLEITPSILKLVEHKLRGHYSHLLKYLWNPNAEFPMQDLSNTNSPAFYEWMVAAITKSRGLPEKVASLPLMDMSTNVFTGNYKWMIFWEERQMDKWKYTKKKYEPIGKSFIHRELQIKLPKDINVESHVDFLYQYFSGSTKSFRPNINDVKRLLGLLPNNPSPLIALLVADNLKYDTFRKPLSKNKVVEMVDWLAEQNQLKYTPPIHLFLATAIVSADSKIRQKASKIWQNLVAKKQLEPIIFGTILGRLKNREWVPLKRFTNLAQNHLLNISQLHNKALEITIAHLLAKLPPIPIKHTKQLLILYRELLASNQSEIKNERLLVLLILWEESPNLRSVLKTLRKYVL